MLKNFLALLGMVSAQQTGCLEIVGNYCVIERSDNTPDGYKLVTVAQAKADTATISPMLGYWSVVALADGKMDGEGYNNKISRGICGKECGEKLLIHTGASEELAVKDDPAAMFEIVSTGMPPASGWRTCTVAQANTYLNQISSMLSDYSYVGLADGSINGPGWNDKVEIKKGVCGPRCGEKLLITLAPPPAEKEVAAVEKTETLTLTSFKDAPDNCCTQGNIHACNVACMNEDDRDNCVHTCEDKCGGLCPLKKEVATPVKTVSKKELAALMIGPADVENFLAGIIEGLIGNNDLPEIKQCLNDTSTIEKILLLAIADFEKGDIADIIKGV